MNSLLFPMAIDRDTGSLKRTAIMGILNITPDSFSDGGRFYKTDAAIQHALEMERDGADIIDIGGESSRPGAEPVTLKEELARTVPVIRAIAGKVKVPISIDTCKAGVAVEALKAGAAIINDISGLVYDNSMADVARQFDAHLIIMHMKGAPATMQKEVEYSAVIDEIKAFFLRQIDHAVSRGVKKEKIILDPGIGFGKNLNHNLEILNRLELFCGLGLPVLTGTSRKSFISRLQGLQELQGVHVAGRLEGTLASVAASVYGGASIVRVHDVKQVKSFLTVLDSIRSCRSINMANMALFKAPNNDDNAKSPPDLLL